MFYIVTQSTNRWYTEYNSQFKLFSAICQVWCWQILDIIYVCFINYVLRVGVKCTVKLLMIRRHKSERKPRQNTAQVDHNLKRCWVRKALVIIAFVLKWATVPRIHKSAECQISQQENSADARTYSSLFSFFFWGCVESIRKRETVGIHIPSLLGVSLGLN